MDDPKSFEAVQTFALKLNRRFRVYMLSGELVFLYAGSGEEVQAALAHSFGAIGELVTAALGAFRKERPADEWQDWSRIDQIVAGHKYNFRAPVAELSDVRIEAGSVLSMTHGPHFGVLHFTQNSSKMRFFIRNLADMKAAMEAVPAALGDVVSINAEWNDRKQRFVKKART